jgi:small-conductance mechanosensitive channel
VDVLFIMANNKVMLSLLLIVSALSLRLLLARRWRKLPLNEEQSTRQWINSAKNGVNFVIVIGLILIWMSELRFVALSIATFVVALVIAAREFIQCFIGSFYHASTRTFAIGDWIKIGPHQGEVVRSDWLSTTLLDIDLDDKSYAYTGKTLVIPNSQLVSQVVQNLNFMRRYVAHSFSIVREADTVNVFAARELLLNKAKEYCLPFQDVALRYNGLMEKRMGISLPGPEASVRITSSDIGKNKFTVTVFCPTHQAVRIEQKLIEVFMEFWYEQHAQAIAEKALQNK